MGSDLELQIDAYVAAARATWPEFGVPPLDFARYLGQRSQEGRLPPLQYAGDLWLACACVQGAALALRCFQAEYAPVVKRLLTRRGATHDMAADVQQQLAERLLVADPKAGRHAKIADYKGLGPLRSWVATAAAMTLVTLQRAQGQRREHPKPIEEHAWLGSTDPELEYLKQRYAPEVREAVIESLATLSDRDKTLLGLYLGKRLNIDTLGAMYGVNRATTARWLAGARRELRHRTVKHLQASLHLNPRECDSLIALVNSQLNVSILKHLPPTDPAP